MLLWITLGFAIWCLLLLILHARYQGVLERKILSIRIHAPWRTVFHSVLHSAIGGLVATILLSIAGLSLSPTTVLGIAILSIILAIVHLRFLSFMYASSIIAIIAFLTQQGILSWHAFHFDAIQHFFDDVHIPSILALTGILYIVEAVLLWSRKEYGFVPTHFFGQRGKLVGGFLIQRIWVLPLLIGTPALLSLEWSFIPSWWPLFRHSVPNGNESLFLLPVVLGFTTFAIGHKPRIVTRRWSARLLLIGIATIGLSYGALYLWWMALVAAIFALVAHEIVLLLLQQKEKRAQPLYTHSSEGMTILAVLRGSPAAVMGIIAGERLVRVNGLQVNTTKELYRALQLNAAFCKLEVLNLAGNVKFVQRSLYSGEHYLLGIILAPDEHSTTYLQSRYFSLLHLLLQKVNIGKKRDVQEQEAVSS